MLYLGLHTKTAVAPAVCDDETPPGASPGAGRLEREIVDSTRLTGKKKKRKKRKQKMFRMPSWKNREKLMASYSTVVIQGAGVHLLNTKFKRVEDTSRQVVAYEHQFSETMTLVLGRLEQKESGKVIWVISSVQAGDAPSIYYVNTGKSSVLPPPNGWTVGESGIAPAPTLMYDQLETNTTPKECTLLCLYDKVQIPGPGQYKVEGAGTKFLNSVLLKERESPDGSPWFEGKVVHRYFDMEFEEIISLKRVEFNHDGQVKYMWVLAGVGTTKGAMAKIYYAHKSICSQTPPGSGWAVGLEGKSPAPTLTKA